MLLTTRIGNRLFSMYPDMNQVDLLSKKKLRISILRNIHEGELVTRKILAIDKWKK